MRYIYLVKYELHDRFMFFKDLVLNSTIINMQRKVKKKRERTHNVTLFGYNEHVFGIHNHQ
jgi:hypothetical protein